MSIMAIHSVCPHAVLSGVRTVVSYWNAMHHSYLIYRNNISFYSELNRQHVGEGFIALYFQEFWGNDVFFFNNNNFFLKIITLLSRKLEISRKV